jgi:outer membrane protein OmpA-like peptidoglycan-associated protein
VVTRDTLRQVTPPQLSIRPRTAGSVVPQAWEVTVEQRGRTLTRIQGERTPPLSIEWETNREQLATPRTGDSLRIHLQVSGAGEAAEAIHTLPVNIVTIERKREERVGDRVIDRYRLILFDFDRAELSEPDRRIVDFIRGQIRPGAKVTITGHTDRIGDLEHNRQLSKERARATAVALGMNDAAVTGFGESPVLYDNEIPEGRFYSRTVQVVVETPME